MDDLAHDMERSLADAEAAGDVGAALRLRTALVEYRAAVRAEWMVPDWTVRGDWRDHVSERVRALWGTFTEEQREALFEQARGAEF